MVYMIPYWQLEIFPLRWLDVSFLAILTLLARWQTSKLMLAGILLIKSSARWQRRAGIFFPGKLNIKQDWRGDPQVMFSSLYNRFPLNTEAALSNSSWFTVKARVLDIHLSSSLRTLAPPFYLAHLSLEANFLLRKASNSFGYSQLLGYPISSMFSLDLLILPSADSRFFSLSFEIR